MYLEYQEQGEVKTAHRIDHSTGIQLQGLKRQTSALNLESF